MNGPTGPRGCSEVKPKYFFGINISSYSFLMYSVNYNSFNISYKMGWWC